jgi:hypothetical protein
MMLTIPDQSLALPPSACPSHRPPHRADAQPLVVCQGLPVPPVVPPVVLIRETMMNDGLDAKAYPCPYLLWYSCPYLLWYSSPQEVGARVSQEVGARVSLGIEAVVQHGTHHHDERRPRCQGLPVPLPHVMNDGLDAAKAYPCPYLMWYASP